MSVLGNTRPDTTAVSRFCQRVTRAVLAGLALSPILGLAVPAGPAQAEQSCSANSYMSGVTVKPGPGPDFTITVAPTENARNAALNRRAREATVTIWHAVQRCVPGLSGQLADSVWQQIECHVLFGKATERTGPTFDFESWHAPLSSPNPVTYYNSQCLNNITNDWAGTGMLIPGALDLHKANSTIA